MNWLITGGCGFIGSRLIAHLVQLPANQVRIVDNLSVGSRADLEAVTSFTESDPKSLGSSNARVELVVGDIRDAQLARKVTQGVDVVVHLAANTGVNPSVEDPRLDCETNVMGTLNYLEGARENGVARFVFASSGAPVGEVTPPIHEELPPHPVSPYGASKLAGEAYCSAYWKTFSLETVALRFGNVYGPGSTHKSSVVAKFTRNAMRSEPMEIYGDGKQTRDFIYIDDLIAAIRSAVTVPGIGGMVFQIAANTETTVGELAERLAATLERKGVARVPIHHGEARPGDVRRNYSDISRARNRLGWSPEHDLDGGLEKTVTWYIENSAANIDTDLKGGT